MIKISAKKALIILFIFGIAGFGVVYALSNKQKKVTYKTVDASLGEIVQTVSETGTVKAINDIKLSFLNSGKIQRLNFKVGDVVKEGQLLAELDYAGLVISKQEAQANYEVATENLNKLLAGSSNEERNIAEATVRQALSSLESAKNELNKTRSTTAENIKQAEKTLRDLESTSSDTLTVQEQAIITAESNLSNAKTSYQQSVNNSRDTALVACSDKISAANTALDTINRILTDEDAKDYLSVKNPVYLDTSKSVYSEAQKQKAISQGTTNDARLALSDIAVTKAISDLNKLLDLTATTLNNTFSALSHSITADDFTQADIDTHKSVVNAQLSSINAAISTLKNVEQNYRNAVTAYNTNVKSAEDALAQAKSAYNNAIISAKNAVNSAKTNADQMIASAQTRVNSSEESLEVAEAQRSKVLAGADTHDISLYRARIRQAQAAIDSINKQIENSQIKATINGQITAANFKVGEQVGAGQPVFSLLGTGDYEIEVLISEADINKVKVGDEALITLDAFGDEKEFTGSVYFIEPAETVIQDVIYYLVDIKFDQTETSIKPGMTANITVTTNKKSNVINIPSRAIVDKGSEGAYVRLLVSDVEKEQKIVTGLRGDEGNIEIVEGLKVGDIIITQAIEN